MKTNVIEPKVQLITYEGGKAARQTPLEELTRSVSTCMLWENTFYEQGSEIAKRIGDLVEEVTFDQACALAVRARVELKLRHVPLWLCAQLLEKRKRHPESIEGIGLLSNTIASVCQRPDEMAELLNLYWKDGKRPLATQLKLGLAKAFPRFSQYQLSKWDRPNAKVKLRDVLFLSHAKPKDEEQAKVWKQLAEKTLPPADTWEVAFSTGKDKKETWTRLLSEKKLGYIALLMNLRNMSEAGVDQELIEEHLLRGASRSKALPFRFISAAKFAPQYANMLSEAMARSLGAFTSLGGDTAIMVDVSGSMDVKLSERSTLTRWEAAGALAILAQEVTGEKVRVFTFSDGLCEVMNVRGLGLLGQIGNSQPHSSTYLGRAAETLKALTPEFERVIIVTDEQAHDSLIPPWTPNAYIVNCAPYKPGLDIHHGWKRVHGFSERLFDWISFEEKGRVLGSEEDEED